MKFTFDKVTYYRRYCMVAQKAQTQTKKENANKNEKVKLTLSF